MIAKALNTPTPVTQIRNAQDSILTCSHVMLKVLSLARRVSGATATVLIQGESGTGKELLARFIHQQSGRGTNSFVAMNCAALPEQLAESELFGYEKGAFTGATQARMGKFEQAHQGTLLLDEISEMPLSLQAKLLRVLQEKEVDHIGGRHPIAVDVRVIATTNRDLRKMVLNAQFREDLYYRLRVIPITVPPLRERKEDIPVLAEYFVEKFCPPNRESMPRLSSQALERMSSYIWPGNVRELENTIERAVLISEGPSIGPEFLLLDNAMSDAGGQTKSNLVGLTVRQMEHKLIGQTLKYVNDNRTNAAKMLGISIRTLRNKLKEYQASGDFIDPTRGANDNE
jgi:transcriptional regulator with PAS, ATPase and Fis domain